MRILSVGEWVQLTFYSSTEPFEQKELRHNIKLNGRIIVVNDLREDSYKTADDVYLVKHEGQDLRVVKMTLDAGASKFEYARLTSIRLRGLHLGGDYSKEQLLDRLLERPCEQLCARPQPLSLLHSRQSNGLRPAIQLLGHLLVGARPPQEHPSSV